MSAYSESGQAIRKPPRLKQDGSGYDWREFDQYLQTVHRLLGASPDGMNAINLFTGHLDNEARLFMERGIDKQSSKLPDIEDSALFFGLMPNQQYASSRTNDDFLTLYWVGA